MPRCLSWLLCWSLRLSSSWFWRCKFFNSQFHGIRVIVLMPTWILQTIQISRPCDTSWIWYQGRPFLGSHKVPVQMLPSFGQVSRLRIQRIGNFRVYNYSMR
jgi:hypothetical protein